MTRVVVDTSSTPVTSMIATKKKHKTKKAVHDLNSAVILFQVVTLYRDTSLPALLSVHQAPSATHTGFLPLSQNSDLSAWITFLGTNLWCTPVWMLKKMTRILFASFFCLFFYWKSCCSVSRLPPCRVLWVFLLVNLLSSPLPMFLHLLADCHRLDLNNTTYLKAISTVIMISNKRNQL